MEEDGEFVLREDVDIGREGICAHELECLEEKEMWRGMLRRRPISPLVATSITTANKELWYNHQNELILIDSHGKDYLLNSEKIQITCSFKDLTCRKRMILFH